MNREKRHITVGEFIQRNYPKLDKSISPIDTEVEKKIKQDYPNFVRRNTPNIYSYRRFDYTLSEFLSQKFLYNWFCDFDEEAQFNEYAGLLCNSGMAGIHTILLHLISNEECILVCPEDIYEETAKLINNTLSKLTDVRYITEIDTNSVSQVTEKEGKTTVALIETITNTEGMSVIEKETIKQIAEKVDYILLDNTLLGAPRMVPPLLSNKNIIYVESLTKTYHTTQSAEISAGYIMAPEKLTNRLIDDLILTGSYLQLNNLLNLPYYLYEVGKENLKRISTTGHEFYQYIRKIDSTAITVDQIDVSRSQFPPVLYLEFDNSRLVEQYLDATNLKQRGSFGHRHSAVLPVGLKWDDAPPGLVRIAFGYAEDPDWLISETQGFIKEYL